MRWYEDAGKKIRCLLCGHRCSIAPGGVGICGVNKNIGQKLECLVYGYPAAINIDPVEKKPLYHFLPNTKTFSLGTVGCNFRCPFCQNWQISQSDSIDKKRFVSPKEIVDSALFHECRSISFTYNEPTIFYPYVKDIAILAKQKGLKTIFVTNGFMSQEVVEDMKGSIDAFNIDIKSFDENYYKKSLKGRLKTILDNARTLKQNGHWVEITTLVVPGCNDSKKELEAIAGFIADDLGKETPWNLSAFHPDYKQMQTPQTSIESLQKAKKIAKEKNLRYIYLGNISQNSKTKCSECKEVLINRKDRQNITIDLKEGCCKGCGKKLEGVFA